jgi:hypothetical protein
MIALLQEGAGGEVAAAAVTAVAAHEETSEVAIAEDRHRNLQACDAVDQSHLAIAIVEVIEGTVAEVMVEDAAAVVVVDEAGVLTNEKTITTKEAKNDGVNLENSMMKKSSSLIKSLNLILVSLVPLLLKQIPSSKFLSLIL